MLQSEWPVDIDCHLGRRVGLSDSASASTNGVETQSEEEGEVHADGHVLNGRYVGLALHRESGHRGCC